MYEHIHTYEYGGMATLFYGLVSINNDKYAAWPGSDPVPHKPALLASKQVQERLRPLDHATHKQKAGLKAAMFYCGINDRPKIRLVTRARYIRTH